MYSNSFASSKIKLVVPFYCISWYHNISNNISVERCFQRNYQRKIIHRKLRSPMGIVRRANKRTRTTWFPYLFPWSFYFKLEGSANTESFQNLGKIPGNDITCFSLRNNLFNLAIGLWVKSRFLRGSRALKGNQSFRPVASLLGLIKSPFARTEVQRRIC